MTDYERKKLTKYVEETHKATADLLQSNVSMDLILNEITEYTARNLCIIGNIIGDDKSFREFLDTVVDDVLEKRDFVKKEMNSFIKNNGI